MRYGTIAIWLTLLVPALIPAPAWNQHQILWHTVDVLWAALAGAMITAEFYSCKEDDNEE